jgi:ATPase subunit of ABC transporter with duplicated ATPase domains
VRKGYGDRLLIDSLSFSLPAGGIVGIIGPNGAGKTTLFRMLSGAEKADGGEIRLGPSVRLAYVDQSRQTLNDNTVRQEISGALISSRSATTKPSPRVLRRRASISRACSNSR